VHARRHVASACFLMLALSVCTSPAWAFLDPPYITPANPTDSDLISVNIYAGECDFVDGGVTWPPPITREGNEFTILLRGGHEQDPEFCYFGVGTHAFPVGVYSPGAYTLRVNSRYSTFDGWVTETLGVISFTVTGVPPKAPVEAPASSSASVVALLAVLMGVAWLGLRRRSRRLR
jgi:hypothetical protein